MLRFQLIVTSKGYRNQSLQTGLAKQLVKTSSQKCVKVDWKLTRYVSLFCSRVDNIDCTLGDLHTKLTVANTLMKAEKGCKSCKKLWCFCNYWNAMSPLCWCTTICNFCKGSGTCHVSEVDSKQLLLSDIQNFEQQFCQHLVVCVWKKIRIFEDYLHALLETYVLIP